jgi:hypothetical protein
MVPLFEQQKYNSAQGNMSWVLAIEFQLICVALV